jgi:hypothetical protein
LIVQRQVRLSKLSNRRAAEVVESGRLVHYFAQVSFFVRVTGILNAGVWFGAAVLFTLVIWPAFGAAEMLRILPPSHSGAAAQVLLKRYCILQYCCGGIALAHFVLEWLYAGKAWPRWIVYWVGGLFALSLFTGLVVLPNLVQRHLELYGIRSTPQQREHARTAVQNWLALVQLGNTVAVLGLSVYVWESTQTETSARFIRRSQTEGLTNRVW